MTADPVTAVFAANLKRFRTERGLSMPKLAELARTTVPTVSRIEHGRGTTLATAGRIAQALGVPLATMVMLPGEGCHE